MQCARFLQSDFTDHICTASTFQLHGAAQSLHVPSYPPARGDIVPVIASAPHNTSPIPLSSVGSPFKGLTGMSSHHAALTASDKRAGTVSIIHQASKSKSRTQAARRYEKVVMGPYPTYVLPSPSCIHVNGIVRLSSRLRHSSLPFGRPSAAPLSRGLHQLIHTLARPSPTDPHPRVTRLAASSFARSPGHSPALQTTYNSESDDSKRSIHEAQVRGILGLNIIH